MVVLDADSVMSGECLSSLVRLMEATPDAGIIQTAPRASGMDTLYARMQQFATRVYGPLFTAGLHFWQLGESHYWGHNAIIRMKPFIEHCALAPLPGKGAFAGAILSHDFVEAALMRRAGWGVWIAYDLPGSYEELPPNLLDELKRDRRWCHGNLMNFRLFLVKGMHPVHRAVFLTGVMSYLSAPLWFLFLVLSTALLAVNTLMEPQYFPGTASALSTVATMAAGQSNCVVLDDHRAAVPAEVAEHHPDLDQGRERVRWQVQGDTVDAAGDVVLHAAGASANDFSTPVSYSPRSSAGPRPGTRHNVTMTPRHGAKR